MTRKQPAGKIEAAAWRIADLQRYRLGCKERHRKQRRQSQGHIIHANLFSIIIVVLAPRSGRTSHPWGRAALWLAEPFAIASKGD